MSFKTILKKIAKNTADSIQKATPKIAKKSTYTIQRNQEITLDILKANIKNMLLQHITKDEKQIEQLFKTASEAELREVWRLYNEGKGEELKQLVINLITRHINAVNAELQRRKAALQKYITSDESEIAVLLFQLDALQNHALYDTLLNKNEYLRARKIARTILYAKSNNDAKKRLYWQNALSELGYDNNIINALYNKSPENLKVFTMALIDQGKLDIVKDGIEKFKKENAAELAKSTIRTLPELPKAVTITTLPKTQTETPKTQLPVREIIRNQQPVINVTLPNQAPVIVPAAGGGSTIVQSQAPQAPQEKPVSQVEQKTDLAKIALPIGLALLAFLKG